jgi:hypothetical protein
MYIYILYHYIPIFPRYSRYNHHNPLKYGSPSSRGVGPVHGESNKLCREVAGLWDLLTYRNVIHIYIYANGYMDIICYSYTIYRNVNMGIYGYNTIYKQFLWLIDEYIYDKSHIYIC